MNLRIKHGPIGTVAKLVALFAGICGLAAVLPLSSRDSAASSLASASSAATGTRWVIETVDSSGDRGKYASLAIQPGTGTPYISYLDQTTYSLRVAYRKPSDGSCGSGNAWFCFVQEPGTVVTQVGAYSSLAFDPNGTLGIAYSVYISPSTSNFYDGHYPGDLLPVRLHENVELSSSELFPARDSSIKFALDGVPRVAYMWGIVGYLHYAHYVGSSGNCGKLGRWQCDQIDSVLTRPSLDVTLGGQPSIACIEHFAALQLATPVMSFGNCGPANSWRCETIDSTGLTFGSESSVSLYVPKCGSACSTPNQIAYINETSGLLKNALYVGMNGNCGPNGSWHCDVIDDIGSTTIAGQRVALVVNSTGSPLIAYEDSNDQSSAILKVGRYVGLGGNCGPTTNLLGHSWQCAVADNGFRVALGSGSYHDVGTHLSMALNSSDLAIIACHDFNYHDLLVAREQLRTFLPFVVP